MFIELLYTNTAFALYRISSVLGVSTRPWNLSAFPHRYLLAFQHLGPINTRSKFFWGKYWLLLIYDNNLQVLAKSAKVIPVMLMGKLVSRAQYKNYEYATAVLISVGMTAFLLGSDGGKKGMGSTAYIDARSFLQPYVLEIIIPHILISRKQQRYNCEWCCAPLRLFNIRQLYCQLAKCLV